MPAPRTLLELVKKYLEHFPQDASQLELLLDQLRNGEELDNRRNFRGHIAGDAVILSPDLNKVLLIYHKRYQVWNQPGGHWDRGEDGPWSTAEREASEETGLENLRRVNIDPDLRVPIHIATGEVPASRAKREPDHWHHDFRYGFIASSEQLPEISDAGVGGSKWVSLVEYENEGGHNFYIAVRRLVEFLRLKA